MEKLEPRDEQLWKIAKKRASFKSHLASYIIINGFLWGMWLLTSGNTGNMWPAWCTLGWGVGLVFHYYNAYVSDESDMVKKEYEKLLKKEREGL